MNIFVFFAQILLAMSQSFKGLSNMLLLRKLNVIGDTASIKNFYISVRSHQEPIVELTKDSLRHRYSTIVVFLFAQECDDT